MELMERYLYDIGRRLPAKQREDIVKELRSLLQDALDARCAGRAPTEEDVAAVLRDFGSPTEVAARYAGERYLIGPRIFDLWWLVLRIVVLCMLGGLLVALGVSLAFDTATLESALKRIADFFASAVTSVFTAFGYVTVIFFLIERARRDKGAKEKLEQKIWDPKDLPRVPVRVDRVGPVGPVVAMVFTLFAMWLFNLHPELIMVFRSLGEDVHWIDGIPALNPAALAAYLPLWNIGWIAGLALQAVLFGRGRWELGSRIAHIALQVFNIGVFGFMMGGPALLRPEVFAGWPEVAVLNDMVAGSFRWLFLILIVVTAIDVIKNLVLVVRRAFEKTAA